MNYVRFLRSKIQYGQETNTTDTLADTLVSELRSALADARAERDHWREQAQSNQQLLMHLRAQESKPVPMTWWQWLQKTLQRPSENQSFNEPVRFLPAP